MAEIQKLQNIISYHSNTGSIIAEKETVKDLGVLMSKDGTFKMHIKNIADAAKKMCGWILRTFKIREVYHDSVVEITSPVIN